MEINGWAKTEGMTFSSYKDGERLVGERVSARIRVLTAHLPRIQAWYAVFGTLETESL